MYWSLLEKHNDGSWWYHYRSFTDKKKAEEYMKGWIWWDKERPKMIIAHKEALPDETMWTYDFKKFHKQDGEEIEV